MVLRGLSQFGVNLVTLLPGALSSLRHWHLNEDEFVMVIEGECLLVEDAGKP
ncbi:cupin domain-containing protein [Gemmobacter lanyuensis]